MIRPKVSIISTAVKGSQDPLYTYLVDPNPDKQEIFNPEDRFLYVNLKAFKKSRSVIVDDGNSINSASSIGDNEGISFITTSEQNGDKYVTTNYMNVDGIESSVEGFGITSIDIDQAADFVPKVKIKFFDVRGSTLKSYELDRGRRDTNNPLSAFFTYPYPVFKLTIKGYYGNPVSYCLHLQRSNYTFDSSNGGYEIEADFVGYTFGFLADIPVKYLYSLPNTAIGKKKLEERGAKSLSDVINDYSKLTRFVSDYKQDNVDYQKIRLLNTIINDIEDIRALVRPLITDEDRSMFTTPILQENINSNNSFCIRNVCVFLENTRSDYNTYYNNLESKLNNVLTILKSNNLTFSDIDIKSIRLPRFDSSISTMINEVKELVGENEPLYDLSVLTEEVLAERNSNFNNQAGFFYVDLYSFRSWIKKTLTALDKQKNEISSTVTDNLNELVQATFNPTIEDFFQNFCANVEVFNEIIHEYTVQASNDGIQRKRKEVIGVNSDIKDDDEIYPFPDVIINQEKAWLGQLDNVDEVTFPELKLIDIFVNSIYDLNTIQKNIDYNRELQRAIENEDLNWFPINALDVFSSDYDKLNSSISIEDFYRVLVQRFMVLNNHSDYFYDKKQIKIWANLESKYAVNVIKNKKYYELFDGSTIDINLLFQQLVNEDFLFEVNGEYGLLEPEVSGVILNQSNILIIKSQNQSFFDQVSIKTNNYNNNLKSYIDENDILAKITVKNQFLLSDKDIQYKDISLDFLNRFTSGQLSQIEDFTSLQFIDGFLNFENPLNIDQDNIYVETQNNTIARNKYLNLYSIFDDINYNDYSDSLKRFLLLDSLGFKENVDEILNAISFKSAIYELPKPILLYLGAILDLQNKFNLTQLSLLEDKFIVDSNIFLKDYFSIITDQTYSSAIIDQLIQYIQDWDYTEIENLMRVYSDTHKLNNSISENIFGYDEYVDAYTLILSFYKKKEVIAVTNAPIINNDEKLSTISDFSLFFNTFKEEFSKKIVDKQKKNQKEEDKRKRVLSDNNILLAIYEDLKAYYDKWISYGEKDGKVFNVCFSDKNRSLFENFYFIDRAWNDIGSKVILNPRILFKLFKNDKINCYEFIGSLLNENNFTVHFAPSHLAFNNAEDLANMFTPQTTLREITSKPAVIAFYVGEMSKYLESDQNYKQDGFSLNETDIPNDFSDRDLAERHINDPNPYNISSFLVNHGDTNQSHFKDIQISTNEYQNTAEYLKTQSDLLDKGGAINRFYKGLDIYDLYKYRSYSATVSAMGNMMIQPFQYFQMNIPLFKGAYIITSTSHSLSPHDHTTTFKGYKISRYVMPLVTEVTSYIDLSFDQSYNSRQLVLNQNEISEDSTGFDSIDEILSQTTVGDNEVLRGINENGNVIRYLLNDDLTPQLFDANLTRVFKNNEAQMNSYGIGKGYCMKWVKNALADIGIRSVPFGGVDAWDLFAGISNIRLNYFPLTFSSRGQSRAYDYQSQISSRLALVWGYFPTSRWKKTSINAIKSIGDIDKIERLSALNRTNYEFNPITHIGIYYDGKFYDLINGVRINPTSSFVPISYLNLYDEVQFLLANEV